MNDNLHACPSACTRPACGFGLVGVTFEPPHAALSWPRGMLAMKRLQLDRIVGLVTPGNTLQGHAAFARWNNAWRRLKSLAGLPIERDRSSKLIKTRYTCDTWNIWCAAAPACTSVWVRARTICGVSTWRTGADRENLCRWRWWTAGDRAYKPPAEGKTRRRDQAKGMPGEGWRRKSKRTTRRHWRI